jgi:hypothetical protein
VCLCVCACVRACVCKCVCVCVCAIRKEDLAVISATQGVCAKAVPGTGGTVCLLRNVFGRMPTNLCVSVYVCLYMYVYACVYEFVRVSFCFWKSTHKKKNTNACTHA